MRNDLSLRPIIRRHLTEAPDWETYLNGFGDEALALRLFEYFGSGDRHFMGVHTAREAQELSELHALSSKLEAKYLALSRKCKDRLGWAYSDIAIMPFSPDVPPDKEIEDRRARLASEAIRDEELIRTGFRYDTEDLPDDSTEMFLTTDHFQFHNALFDVVGTIASATEDLSEISEQRRQDWRICSVAAVASMAWYRRTGKTAPKTAHADAPGPFGIFLEDILNELFSIYGLPPDTAPSARSALRALDKLNNSDVEFLVNW